jgi:hypothetical protein
MPFLKLDFFKGLFDKFPLNLFQMEAEKDNDSYEKAA